MGNTSNLQRITADTNILRYSRYGRTIEIQRAAKKLTYPVSIPTKEKQRESMNSQSTQCSYVSTNRTKQKRKGKNTRSLSLDIHRRAFFDIK